MKNKKIIITVVLIALLNGIVLTGWIYFLSVIKNQADMITEIRSQIAVNEKKAESDRSLKNLMTEIAVEKQKIDSVFLDKQSIIKLIEELESIANKTGTSIDIGSVNSFSLKGNFSQLFHYLVLLENIPYTININKMSLQQQGKDIWRANFEISLISFSNI
jgi:sRNA-binding regulator protein Hfq